MSRSSLEKQFKYQSKYLQQQNHQIPAVVPQLPYQMGYPLYATGNLPEYGSSVPIAVPCAPIPLTGDDEDYEPEAKKNALPIHGNTSNFNINTLLHTNILQSDYFRALYQLRTYHEVLQEIKTSVLHVEPWQTGTSRIPSSAFCLLLKLMLMKVTHKQMKGMLNYEGFPAIRAIGFIYLRYTCPPSDLWKWFEEYLEDDEEISPSADQSIKMTIGQYCKLLLTEMNYFGQTQLPRIPVPVERKIKVMLLLLEEKQKRRRSNLRAFNEGLFCVGTKVRAIYSDEENEPAWYDAVIESVDESNDQKFWVLFTEYGNKECVDLGDMDLDLPGEKSGRFDEKSARCTDSNRDKRRSRSRSRSRNRERERQRGRSRSRSRDRPETRSDNLLDKVLQTSREASTSVGKNYGQRPASYKGSLSLKLDRFTVRRQSPSPDRDRNRQREHGHHSRSRDQEGGRREDRRPEQSSFASYNTSMRTDSGSISYEQRERMKALREKYGDVSAGKESSFI